MISNELSSEIAAAVLAAQKSPQELKQLKDVILQVHIVLQKMSEEARDRHLQAKLMASRLTSGQ
ncbi:MAG TPA: hypothetical protein VKB46_27905 [Pyrinomonadaceae bacterium]|nr:hypothetical protein [Pyrinomonadaceae bacterium]